MASLDLLTFSASVGGSLIVSYVGVRYFTGAKIRAERADVARRELRRVVAPWLRAARSRVAGRGRSLQREARTSDTKDGVSALAVLRIAEDLPAWRRALVRRRCRIIFGNEWSDLVVEQIDLAADAHGDAGHLLTRALFKYTTGRFVIPGGSPLDRVEMRLWGARVAVSSGIPAGTALLADPAAAHQFIRSDITVAATNSHGDDFTHNMIRLIAEVRFGVAVPSRSCSSR